MSHIWKLTFSITLTLGVICSALGVLYALTLRDEHDHPRWAAERLLRQAEPAWKDMAIAYREGVPPATMAIPEGDPVPTLRTMAQFELVDVAYYCSPQHRLTVVPSFPRIAPFTVDLKTWEPTFSMTPFNRSAWPRDEAGKALFRQEVLIRDVVDSTTLAGHEPRFMNWRSPFYFIRGDAEKGWLIYRLSQDKFLAAAGQQALKRHGIPDTVSWRMLRGEGRGYPTETIHPDLPTELADLSVDLDYMSVFQEELALQAQAAYLLLGLSGAFLFGVLGTSRQIRAILHERHMALAQSDFVSGVSHEMRTPLTTIKMYAEMMEQGLVETPEKQTAYLRTIGGECDRLTRLIENVLDYARISGRRREYHFEPLDARALIDEAIGSLEGPLARAGIRVELVAPERVPVVADRDAVVQAMINLIGNAIKYAPGEKRILVTAEADNGALRLAVRDFGPGIPRGEQRKIFKPFYRAGSELTRQSTGSGLGLALVQEYARAHRGKVELESKPGEGATFTLVLPRGRKPA